MNELSRSSRLSMRLAQLALLVSAMTASACGDDVMVAPDGGPHDDAAPVDAHVPTPPVVIATSPTDGASDVPRDSSLQIAFSEPMDVTTGSIGAASDAGSIDLADATWSEDRTTLTVAPTSPFPPGATITVTVGSTFRDLEGDALSPSYTFEISTLDDVAPTIVRSTPAEGASNVAPDTATLELELSETMRIALGSARIEGPGAPTLGSVSWTDRVASWPVSGLLAESTYRVVLDGFVDSAGNALDTSALGAEGALDFTTGADERAPVVVASTPGEGQLDVDVGLISQVAIELSEPMDESAGTVTLELGGTTTELDVRWDRGGRRLLVPIGGRLAAAAPHRLVLTGFADVAGNALDGTVYLIDGALDFTTGTDSFVPFVAFTSPEDGETGIAGGRLSVTVVFSEAMDASITTAPMTGDGRTVTLTGTWSSGDTVLTLEAPTLQAGRTYDLDLRGFRDVGGTAVDAAHPYLGDGRSTFTLATPTGERCGDALTEAEATSSAAGRVQWVLPAGAASTSDGSTPCDTNGHGPDVLVRYRKTTPAARDGGAALHVSVVAATDSHDLDVDILQGDCRPTGPVADASRLRCLANGEGGWQSWLDVGPGDYFVWVARDQSAAFSGATVTIEELPAVREGESCSAPFDTASAAPIYTAPTAVGQPHRWSIPAGYASAPDRGALPEGPVGALSCAPDTGRNHDVVVAFQKTTASSLVTVRVAAPSVSTAELGIEVARGCDPADPTYAARECQVTRTALTREWTLDGPAGPHSAWLVSNRRLPLPGGAVDPMPAATIEISEFEPQPGDSCATAIPITAGTNTVTANRPHRAHVPVCLASGGVTWFRYTPSQGLGVLRTNGATIGAVVDRTSGEVMRCLSDDTTAGIPVFGVPGQEVCVALSSNTTVSQITLQEIPYSGVRGIASGFDVVVPTGVASPSTSAWMAVLGDDLYRSGTGRIQTVPTTGGPLAQQSFTGLTIDGGGAVARPDGLYVLSSSASATSGPRVFRVTDATGAFLATPVPLEILPTGFVYPARAFAALTWDGTQFLAATTQSTSVNTSPDCCTPVHFYAIPADGSMPTPIGTNEAIDDISGLAADATFLYVTGRTSTGRIVGGVSEYSESIQRLRRTQLGDPAQVPVVLFSGPDLSNGNGGLFVDDTGNATVLYLRAYGSGSDVFAIVEPDADAPVWSGALWRSGGAGNQAGLGYDPTTRSLWFLDTTPNPDRWVRLD